MSRDHYEPVKKGHIVPQVYQRNFAIDEKVAVHVDGSATHVTMSIRDAGTRARFYRRVRPKSGEEIDDIEASISYIETAVQPVFADLLAGLPLTMDRKGVLAQFFGLQMVRGPAFFEQRRDQINAVVTGMKASDFKPKALRKLGGNLQVAKQEVRAAYLSSTQQMTTMITTSYRIGSVIGSMRWELIRFDRPLLAYSDHPVVVWPADELSLTKPFDTPRLAPLSAYEVLVPVSPQLAVAMTWLDLPDSTTATSGDEAIAGTVNALVIGQADRQWMHQLPDEPPVASGRLVPVSQQLGGAYSVAQARDSTRRAHADRYIRKTRDKKFLTSIEIAQVKLGRQ